jgi:uroporphyrin-III C-methyltransferase/precorrin-2 dehydrogenase/sirohydrochlorin ferrochelatase
MFLPLFLRHSSFPAILIVGGGKVATAKAETLISIGASIEVVTKSISQELLRICERYGFFYKIVHYQSKYLDGKRIVIAATEDKAVNKQIYQDCRDNNILVNVVDEPDLCDFIFPALVRRGPLQVAVSSSGISPVLTRIIKRKIEQIIPEKFEKLIQFLEDKKNALIKKLSCIQSRRLFLEKLINGPIGEEILEGNDIKAELLFRKALKDYPNEDRAALYLVGAGPGNADLMTVKSIKILSQADVVIYDRLIPNELLEKYARKDAYKINAGKTRCCHYKQQNEVNTLIAQHLKAGHIVVRLKGGDPGIYAHCAEEISIARNLNFPYQIIPGISAVNGCAAYAGIPLTDRDGIQSLRLMTLYSHNLENENFWDKLSFTQHETIVFYMSSRNYSVLCNKLANNYLPDDTPFLIIEQGTTSYQREYHGTLAEFDKLYGNHQFVSPSLLIIGRVINLYYQGSWKESTKELGSYFPEILSNFSKNIC